MYDAQQVSMFDALAEELGLDEVRSTKGSAEDVNPVRLMSLFVAFRVRWVAEEADVGEVVNWEGGSRVPRGCVQELNPPSAVEGGT